jgi:hypothetical protein
MTVIAAAVMAVVVAAGGTTLGVVLSDGGGSSAQRLEYRSLPRPCELLTANVLAGYLPDGAADPDQPRPDGQELTAGCEWISVGDHQNRSLSVVIRLFDGASGLAQARQAFTEAVANTKPDDGNGVAITSHPVAGVGDQASAVDASAHSSTASQPLSFTGLVVRSGNVVATVTYLDITIPLIGAASVPRDLAGLADQVTLARDVLAVLARPATAAPATMAAPAKPGYGVPAHACRLVPAAVLRSYLPGATASTDTPDTPTGGVSDCFWSTQSGGLPTLFLTVAIFGSAQGEVGPLAAYETEVQQQEQNGGGTTVLRAQPVTGVGAQATAIQTTSSRLGSQGVTLVVMSGDAVVQLTYQASGGAGQGQGSPPSRAAQLAAVTVLARAVLAALPAT